MKHNLNIIHSELCLGLEKPIRFLQITDTHITRGDPSGGRRREAVFNKHYENCAEDYFFASHCLRKRKRYADFAYGRYGRFLVSK